MSQIGPGNHERAWNDPPQMAFALPKCEEQKKDDQSAGSKSRLRMMNKRIPVPLGSNINNSSVPHSNSQGLNRPPLNPLSMPPIRNTPIGPPPKKVVDHSNSNEDNPDSSNNLSKSNHSSEEMLKFVIQILISVTTEFSSRLQDHIKSDINKRIDLLSNMWNEDKLNSDVQNRLYNLCKALEDKDYNKAWSLHQRLIVDYTSVTTPWMIGIKNLIMEGKSSQTKTQSCSSSINSPLDIQVENMTITNNPAENSL